MTERVQTTIDALISALNAGKMAKGACTSCAVGVMVANGMNMPMGNVEAIADDTEDEDTLGYGYWIRKFYTYETGKQMNRTWESVRQSAKYSDGPSVSKIQKEIKSTGFSLKELMLIENTFETNTKIYIDDYKYAEPAEIREDLINGLTAVVKVLLKIDNCPESVTDVFTSKVCSKQLVETV